MAQEAGLSCSSPGPAGRGDWDRPPLSV